MFEPSYRIFPAMPFFSLKTDFKGERQEPVFNRKHHSVPANIQIRVPPNDPVAISTQQLAGPNPEDELFDPVRLPAARKALQTMPMPDENARRYLEKHIPRLSRTVALIPPPAETGRILELGCYIQITPLLSTICGYPEVRGAYFGPAGRIDTKTVGGFTCKVDHFDAERDSFPYPEGHFDVVVAGEIIEHMIYDPMHLVVESRRVLREGGALIVTTPNVGSITSAIKAFEGRDNPQIFFLYKRPDPNEEPEIGHMREYTAFELGETMRAGGFEVERLFTTFIDEYAQHRPWLDLVEACGFSIENRGEQTWCVARKRGNLPVDRYPWFLYSPA